MNFRVKNIYLFLLSFMLLAPALQSCYDDLDNIGPDGIPEGNTTVYGVVDFMPMAERAMGTRGDASYAVPGDGLGEIRDLCVLIYDTQQQLREIREITITDDMKSLITRKPGDAVSGGQPANPSEENTWRVKFKIEDLPFGKYYIYAVANVGKYSENGTVQSSYTRLSQKKDDGTSIVQTPDELAALRLEWDPKEYRNNGGMLGHFSIERSEHAPSDWHATQVVINRDNMELHSWLRRAASKVTIDFDPSGLRDNIKVWIRKAEVCDIPKSCPLGMMNAPGSSKEALEEVLYRQNDKSNNASSHHLYYADKCFRPSDLDKDGVARVYDSQSDDHEKWPMLQKGSGKWPLNAHEPTQQALFFYENRQNSNGPCKDKRQFPDQNGGVADREIKKDNKPYGTYIEIEAYYQNLNPGTMSQGKIIYRFMLGQNEIDDYDAFRNHHYKVTMQFRGNANDVDWHIEYSDPEPIVVPVPYYISYLYKHDMKLPLKMTPKDPDRKITKLSAEIIRNDWYPYNGNTEFYYTGGGVTENNESNRAMGFLSLKPTDLTVVGSLSMVAGDARDYNNKFYYGKIDGIDRSKRTYKVDRDYRDEFKPTGRSEEVILADTVNVTPDAKGNGIEWMIPMYTRAKQLVKTSGYTGNNPYVGHYRMGRVRFTATLDGVDRFTGKNTIEKEVDIRQVERIVNPKGIYRKWDSREPFQVTLKKLNEENASSFSDYISDGPWRAFIVRGDRSFIDIGKPGMKNVSGDSGTPIDFSVRFKGCSNAQEVKSCVIRVEYNNYSCVHLIFVRQGYEPQELFEGDAKWHIANMRGAGDEAPHPCDEGSMFRFANWSQPIDVGASHLPAANWAVMTPKSFLSRDDELDIYKGTPTKWVKIEHKGMDSGASFGGNVATIEQFKKVVDNPLIEQGYGVLYADGATETASDIAKAYGYNRALGHTDGYGMRGVFCYNRGTDDYGGRSIFLPIGHTGYGQRKDGDRDINGWNGPVSGLNAVLRYAASRTENMSPSAAEIMPLFWDLYRKPGGIYWGREMANVKNDAGKNELKGGLDINYFSFDFNVIDAANLFGKDKSNACFLRCAD